MLSFLPARKIRHHRGVSPATKSLCASSSKSPQEGTQDHPRQNASGGPETRRWCCCFSHGAVTTNESRAFVCREPRESQEMLHLSQTDVTNHPGKAHQTPNAGCEKEAIQSASEEPQFLGSYPGCARRLKLGVILPFLHTASSTSLHPT